MKTSKRNMLELAIAAIIAANIDKIDALETQGPRGGSNLRIIPGWSQSPNSEISRACRKLGVAGNWWNGSNPTPATGIPTCISPDCQRAYKSIYGKEV